MTKVLETYTSDGIDIIHEWSTVEEALDSGSFDYLWENYYDDDENPDNLYECETIEELIEKVSYPFEIIEE